MRLTTVEFPGDAMMLRSQDGGVMVAIPIRIQRYSGRRQVVVPQGISATLNGQRAPTALQVALARGHRWLRQIEGRQARNLAEIADREKIDRSYVSRMVNLTTLAPDIQAAILDETLPEEVVLFDLAIDTPLCWQAQRQRVTDVVAKVRAGKALPAAQTWAGFFLSQFLRCRPMLEKTSVVSVVSKLLIFKELPLRTWPFARPQGVEKESGKTGQERQNQASRRAAKSASPSEKPRQAWGLTGLIEMQRECLCKL